MSVYIVNRADAPEENSRMVEARTASAAIAHVARTSYGAIPISTKEAVSWAKKGVELEDAKAGKEAGE